MHTYSNRIRSTGPFRRPNVKNYISKWSSPNEKPHIDWHVVRVLEEQGFDIIISPRNIYDPSQLYERLELYQPDKDKFVVVDEHVKAGLKLAYATFARPANVPYLKALEDPIDLLATVKFNKSAGATAIDFKKGEVTQYALDRMRQIIADVKAPNPCLAFARTGENNSTRLVWGYPFEMTLLEGAFARPLIQRFSSFRTNMAFQMTKCNVGQIIGKQISKPGETLIAMDYSKFDSSISSWAIHKAFQILGTWFDEITKKRLGWDKIIHYFLHTPIVMPDGNLYKGKKHGVPSGSYFTQMVDSVVNTLILGAVFSKFNQHKSKHEILTLGDDSIFSWKGNARKMLKAISAYIFDTFGVKVNVDKTKVGEAHFLGATWVRGLPRLSVYEIKKKAVNPESGRKYSKDGDFKEQAMTVLASYMASYVEASQLYPWFNNFVQEQMARHRRVVPRGIGTGLNRFLQDEADLAGRTGPLTMNPTRYASDPAITILK